MRELNVCEVGAVAGGESFEDSWASFGNESLWGFVFGLATDVVGSLFSPSYGNGNGATGPGYSGAGIGGNVPSGSTGSSHFG